MPICQGQKARLALSRVLYFDADIYLFDDPLSAVDAKVAKHIFEEAILPLASHKTVILVTHQVPYLSKCDEVLIIDGGKIVKVGTPTELEKELKNEKKTEEKGEDMRVDVGGDKR